MRKLIAGLALITALAVALSYFGHLHPALDMLTVVRRPLQWLLILLIVAGAAVLRHWPATSVLALAGVAMVANQATPSEAYRGPIRVYSKNLFYHNTELAALTQDLIDSEADALTLQELHPHNETILDALSEVYPHQVICGSESSLQLAILSRWPLSHDSHGCSNPRSLQIVKVGHPERMFWLVNVHLQQPWPDEQWQRLALAEPLLDRVAGPVIIAGDFNAMPWSATAKRIANRFNAKVTTGATTTFHYAGLPLALDQVWAADGYATRRPRLGSDHFGILADVTPAGDWRGQ